MSKTEREAEPSERADMDRILLLLSALNEAMDKSDATRRLTGCFLFFSSLPLPVARDKEIAGLRKALIQALEPVREVDAGQWDSSLRDDVYGTLRECANPKSAYYSPGLAIALLETFARIGAREHLSYIARLAESPITKDRHHERICVAASRSRDAIQARLDRQRVSGTLLRPASGPDTPADTLLRPAQTGSDTDPRQLLRSVDRETSSIDVNVDR